MHGKTKSIIADNFHSVIQVLSTIFQAVLEKLKFLVFTLSYTRTIFAIFYIKFGAKMMSHSNEMSTSNSRN